MANENDPTKKQKIYQEFLDKYGSAVDDMDLSSKTLREKTNALNKLLELNKGTSQPNEEHEMILKHYVGIRKIINNQIRIPKNIFDKLVKKVRSNVALREDRRFYEFAMDYKIRVMLLELGNRLGISGRELFNKSWKEMKNEAN